MKAKFPTSREDFPVSMKGPWASAYTGISLSTLCRRRLTNDPNGPPYRKCGGSIIYLKHELDEYLQRLPGGGGLSESTAA